MEGTIDSNFSGYTGDGFANAADTNGASIFWNTYFDSSVVNSFTFRYASTNDRTANLIVNGVNVASEILFPSTGSFSTWDFVTVNAYAVPGAAEVRLQAATAAGLPHVDYVELIGGGAENAAPALAAISNRTLGVGQTLNVTNPRAIQMCRRNRSSSACLSPRTTRRSTPTAAFFPATARDARKHHEQLHRPRR